MPSDTEAAEFGLKVFLNTLARALAEDLRAPRLEIRTAEVAAPPERS